MSIAFDGETNGIGLKIARLKKRIKKKKIAELDIRSFIYSSPKDTRKRKGMRDNGASKVRRPLNKQDQKCIEDKSRDAQARSVKDGSFKKKRLKEKYLFCHNIINCSLSYKEWECSSRFD